MPRSVAMSMRFLRDVAVRPLAIVDEHRVRLLRHGRADEQPSAALAGVGDVALAGGVDAARLGEAVVGQREDRRRAGLAARNEHRAQVFAAHEAEHRHVDGGAFRVEHGRLRGRVVRPVAGHGAVERGQRRDVDRGRRIRARGAFRERRAEVEQRVRRGDVDDREDLLRRIALGEPGRGLLDVGRIHDDRVEVGHRLGDVLGRVDDDPVRDVESLRGHGQALDGEGGQLGVRRSIPRRRGRRAGRASAPIR